MRKEYKGAPAMQKFQQFKTNVGTRFGNAGLEDQILNGLKSTSANGGNTFGINTWNEQMTQLGYGSTADGEFDVDNLIDQFNPEYADQIMPFNITISMANEFGQQAGMEIYGVQLLNEASGFSVDDVITAKAYTFVARKVKSVEPKTSGVQTGQSSGNAASGDILQGGMLA